MKRAGAAPHQELVAGLTGCAGPLGPSASVPFGMFPGAGKGGRSPQGSGGSEHPHLSLAANHQRVLGHQAEVRVL